MHNKHAPILICLRTTIQIFVPKVAIRRPSRINGSFLIPKHLYIINNIKALASCTTSVYVNLSKNSFFLCHHPKKSAKADAKIQLFLIPSKFFEDFFYSLTKVFEIINKAIRLHLIYIYKATRKSPQYRCHQVHRRDTNKGYIPLAYRRRRSH